MAQLRFVLAQPAVSPATLLGHAPPEVVSAVTEAVGRGTSYGTPTRSEVELAEEIVARTSVEVLINSIVGSQKLICVCR